MEEGKPSGDVQQHAQELQDLFQENGQIEREKNQLLGQTDTPEPVTFKPIVVEALPPEEAFPAVSDPYGGTLASGGGTAATREASAGQEPCPSEPDIAQPAARTVTIVQTAVTHGRVPRAALRGQNG